MKHLFLSGIIAITLSACATGPTAYGPAYNGNGMGFENQKIEQDRFRISYTGRHHAEARDFALLRAAEVALAEGYSHFQIIGGDRYDNGPNPAISTGVGVAVGRGYRGRSRTNVNLGAGVHDVGRALEGSKVTETIEIRLKHSGGNTPDIYDAKSVTNSIKPAVFQ